VVQSEFLVVLVLAIPIIAFPALLWYLGIGRSYAAIREAMKRRADRRRRGLPQRLGELNNK